MLELYAESGPAVYTLALHVTCSPDAAAEITYDVFTAVVTGPHQASPAVGTLRTQLVALTHRRATRAARRTRSAAATRSTEVPPTGATLDAQQLARGLALAAQMGGAAANLDPQQRLALALTYSAGRTVGDTARILGLSRSTVLRQLATGLRLLAPGDPGTGPDGARR
jgi:RNA polymerase sigma-70 factor (ECF subfamily)